MPFRESGIHKCACGIETIEEDGVCRICKAQRRKAQRREKTSIDLNEGGEEVANVPKEKLCEDCQKPYAPTSNAQKRCNECARARLRKNKFDRISVRIGLTGKQKRFIKH
jgi:hypothetical protein